MSGNKPLFGGTIDGRNYFNGDYLTIILKLIEEQQHNLLNLETENLLDILDRYSQHIIQIDKNKIFLNTVKDYFINNFKLTNSFEIVKAIEKISNKRTH